MLAFCRLSACIVSVRAQHNIYDQAWYNGLSATAQSQYDHLAEDITQKKTEDHYSGFGPIFVRAAFHASGTYHKRTNTSELNGGNFRHRTEMEHSSNNCLDTATAELEKLALKNQVSFADTVAIAASLGLQEM
ncbi:hypothetical protein SARC_03275 [Sphaeroforma arctica JP610]|uniref:Uncharacterized protein n=1 Tax=Sphaeroforma arctica JP610 TaxID=667725 RepID=A0A0L0G6J2_9EUKA|nr:hypothetical protein SARC_03275 [Sphaeroforma arctica JP610]KNC84501.1 hypothetical protein SARC_03275 [Sphaeroforma arctica JP610]|eukprot:XP_014158403.1 hypothetical protein SARC_03275 [Sphaeroforma arctica JP610]